MQVRQGAFPNPGEDGDPTLEVARPDFWFMSPGLNLGVIATFQLLTKKKAVLLIFQIDTNFLAR